MKKIAYIFCYGSFLICAVITFGLVAIAEERIPTVNILEGIFVIIIS